MGRLLKKLITNSMEQKKQTFRQVVRRFFEPAIQNKKMLFQSCFFALRIGLYGIFNVWIFELITSNIELKNKDAFVVSIIIYCAITLTYFLGNYFMKYWHRVNRYRTDVKSMHNIYMKDFFMLDNNEVEKFWTGKWISIIENGFHTWTDLIIFGIHTWIRVIITFFYVSYVFITTNNYYFIAFIILFIGLHIFANYLNKFVIPYRNKRIDMQYSYNAQMVKMIMSKFEITQSNKEKRELWILDEYADNCVLNNQGEHKYLFFITNMPVFLVYVLKISICVYLWYWILNGTAQFSELVWIIILIGLLEKVLSDSIDYYKEFTFHYTGIKKLWDHFDDIKKIKWLREWIDFKIKWWNIEICDVSYWYEERNKIFQNFSLKIKWWTKTAFVGESWGGKTTLIKLLAWYIRSDSGTIKVDNQNLSDIKLTDYYKHIGYLTQDPSVFDWTIYENLVYALEVEPTKDNLEKVIKLAKCEFIREYKRWLKTEVGEKWIKLSWWQKQRLAIAKIMLKNPNIILLDEPTSALDSFNEELVNAALHNLFKGKTVIVVAHRLQTVKQSDRILLLEKWKILEEWTHDELVKLNGKYKRMLDLQSWF